MIRTPIFHLKTIYRQGLSHVKKEGVIGYLIQSFEKEMGSRVWGFKAIKGGESGP